MQLSFYIFLFIFQSSGIAFFFEVLVFVLFTSLVIPKIILTYYDEEVWKIINITREHWVATVGFSIFAAMFFISNDTFQFLSISFTRTGLGKLSFGSLIQAPVFEEFLFRGVILGLSLKMMDEDLAAIINGILFGMWHVGAYFKYGFIFEVTLLVFSTAIFGYILAKIHHRKKNLLICIALHTLGTLFIAVTGFPIGTK